MIMYLPLYKVPRQPSSHQPPHPSKAMEDFNLPSPERVALLKRLQESMGGAPEHFWAACQICDLTKLREFVELAYVYPVGARDIAVQTYPMVSHGNQSAKGPLASSSSPATSPVAKRQKISDSHGDIEASHHYYVEAKQRDGGCCVLTGDGAVDVAHIYPFCSLKDSEEDIFGARRTFWNRLQKFWPEEKVAAWKDILFPRGLSESGGKRVNNLITLSKTTHDKWNQGAFAIKPIYLSNDKTALEVRFFWQKKQQNTQGTMSLLTIPHSTEGLNCNEGVFDSGSARLFNVRDECIKSGDSFKLKTDDPTKKPLPSFELLELQWFLMRVMGMAGAAFPYEAGWGDDSDSDIPNLELDEMGDTSFISDFGLLDSQCQIK